MPVMSLHVCANIGFKCHMWYLLEVLQTSDDIQEQQQSKVM